MLFLRTCSSHRHEGRCGVIFSPTDFINWRSSRTGKHNKINLKALWPAVCLCASCLTEKDERCQRRPAACLQYSQRWTSEKKAKYIVLYLKNSLSSKVKKYVYGGWKEEPVRHLTWSRFRSLRCHVILYFVLHHKRLPGPTERCSGKPDIMSSFTSSCIIKLKNETG